MKNFEMCSNINMALGVANYFNNIPMGETLMATSALKFVFSDYDPEEIHWKVFRREIRRHMKENPDQVAKSIWFGEWKKQHPDLYKEWFEKENGNGEEI